MNTFERQAFISVAVDLGLYMLSIFAVAGSIYLAHILGFSLQEIVITFSVVMLVGFIFSSVYSVYRSKVRDLEYKAKLDAMDASIKAERESRKKQ